MKIKEGQDYQLEGFCALDLPIDYARQRRTAVRRGATHFSINGPASTALDRIAREQGANLFALLLAAFKTLLHRYTGQSDIAVGSGLYDVTGTASHRGIDLIRTKVSADTTFASYMREVHRAANEAGRHHGAPDAAPQVTFNYQDSPSLEEGSETGDSGLSEISLTFERRGDALRGDMNFDADLFAPETIQRMVGHYQTLIESILDDPSQKLCELPLLTEQERATMLQDWNQTSQAFACHKCVHHLFEEQARRTPDRPAVIFQDQQLTYRELDAKANQLAHELRNLGVGPEVRVGVCLLRSLEMVVAMYAIHKAGGAYVPLDPTYPRDRIEFILADAQVPLVLTQKSLAGQVPCGTAKLLCVDAGTKTESDQSDELVLRPISGVTPENLAYVIYTSGSTGKPKGVMVRHRNVANLFTGLDHVIGTEPGTWLAVTSISFDISVLELFWTLARGFTVVLHGDDAATLRKFSGPSSSAKQNLSIAEEVSRFAVTHLQCTPSLAGMMLDDPESASALAEVNTFLFGGEALPPTLPQRLPAKARILNMYGPTETTVWSLAWSVPPNSSRISIGRPIANTRVYILDANLQPVPVGVAGELYIAGDGVTRGYLNRPELTEERFIPEIIGGRPELRMYRTGDLARFNMDGSVDFLGRIDNQVKIRGHRIELGEIEAVLRNQSGVKDAVVSIWQPAADDTRLVAYYVSERDSSQLEASLRTALKDTLPDYMVPTLFMRLDALPLTPNGKIDRKALPSPLGAPSEKSDRSRMTEPSTKSQTTPARSAIAARLPLTEAQREIWTASEMSSEVACSFNQSVLLKLKGALEFQTFVDALQWLVDRHEALRVTFAPSGDEQLVHSSMPVNVEQIDLPANSDGSTDAILNDLLRAEAATPFNLAEGPLFRFTLVQLSDHEHALLLTLHHIICDGGSLGVLIGELGEYYSARINGGVEPGSLEMSYTDFVRRQTSAQQTQAREKAEAFWLNQWKQACAPLALPTDRKRPARRTFAGAACERRLNAAASRSIKALAASQHCSLSGTMLAGCYLLLHRLTGQRELAIGLPITSRDGAGSERLVGHCVNFLPLRLDLHTDISFAQHIREVWGILIAAIQHQHVTLGSLLEKNFSDRTTRGPTPPPISVMFNVDCADQDIAMSGFSTEVKANPFCNCRFDLSFSVADVGGTLVLRCEYNREILEAKTVERWLDYYGWLMSTAATNPLQVLGKFPQLHVPHRAAQTSQPASGATARLAAAAAPVTAGTGTDVMTETEKKIAAIWREVLLIENVGPHDGFFDVGGHSLLATKVTARIGKTFGISLPVRYIFEAPTLAELSGVVDRLLHEKPKPAASTVGGATRSADMQKVLQRLAQLSDAELENLIHNVNSQGK